jgi:hypothetical protein
MMRVGLNDFNDEDGQLMLNAITQIESNNLSDGEALLTELKEVFK